MREIFRVAWTVTPLHAPRVWRHCRRCSERRPFACSGKFRANAQKKRLDIWLIYRCVTCHETWNIPIIERATVGDIAPDALAAYAGNDPAAVARHGFDIEWLKRHGDRIESLADYTVIKRPIDGDPRAASSLLVVLSLGLPYRVRLDGVLAKEFGISRGRLQRLSEDSALQVLPTMRHALRSSILDGQRISIDLKAAPEINPWLQQWFAS